MDVDTLPTLQMTPYGDIRQGNPPRDEWGSRRQRHQQRNLLSAYTGVQEMKGLHESHNSVLQNKAEYVNNTLQGLGNELHNKQASTIRSIRWNQYFHKKYKTQTYIVGMILIVCVLILLAHASLSPAAFPIAAGSLLAILFIYCGYLLWDLSIRDPEIFDEYNFFSHTGTLYRNKTDDLETDTENCIIKNMESKIKKL